MAAWVAPVISGLAGLFGSLFGGGGSKPKADQIPPELRQMMQLNYRRATQADPLYQAMLAMAQRLAPGSWPEGGYPNLPGLAPKPRGGSFQREDRPDRQRYSA